MLLSPPVTARLSVVPFVLAQIVLIWLWIVLHRRRLHDAGRPTGIVIGIAAIYALEVVLLVLLMWLMLSVPDRQAAASGEASIFQLFVLLYLLALMTGDPDSRRPANMDDGLCRAAAAAGRDRRCLLAVDGDATEPALAAMTTLHFAYGANMSRAVMRKYAPGARALGVAALADHRFVITADGYASVEPARAQTVHGVLWRITPRDRVMLDAWENVGGGLYRAEIFAVRRKRCLAPALSISRGPSGEGRPKPGYMELVIAAAREWELPEAYIRSLEGFALDAAAGRRRAQDRRVPVTVIRHVVFRGRVQGVGFRAFVEDVAAARRRRLGAQPPRRHRRGGVGRRRRGRRGHRRGLPQGLLCGPRRWRRNARGRDDELALRGNDTFAVLPTV